MEAVMSARPGVCGRAVNIVVTKDINGVFLFAFALAARGDCVEQKVLEFLDTVTQNL